MLWRLKDLLRIQDYSYTRNGTVLGNVQVILIRPLNYAILKEGVFSGSITLLQSKN